MKRLLFIYNPLAGKSQIKNYLSDIIDIFVKANYEVTVRPTQEKRDAYITITEIANEFDLLVTSGGDGTLNETVSGLMQLKNRPRLGYIPAGTTNDFASSLGLSKIMTEAAETIVKGENFFCDIGSFNERFFTYVAAFGAFTEVAYQTTQQSKNMLGHLAYVLEGIKSLKSIKAYHMTVEYDGNVIEDDFIFGMVSNSMSVGGFKGKGELGIVLDDGLFEAAFIKMPKSAIELQATINALLKLEFDCEYIYFFRSSKINISCGDSVSWTLDGEFGGSVNDVAIQNQNKAICIVKNPD